MADPTFQYKRTSGHRNLINQMAWLPKFKTVFGLEFPVAVLRSGRQYLVKPNGWKRLTPKSA